MTWLTCAMGFVDHAVPDRSRVESADTGMYATVCGARIYAGSLAAPPARRCPECERLLGTAGPRRGGRGTGPSGALRRLR